MVQDLIKVDISQIPDHITKEQYLKIREYIQKKEYSKDGKKNRFYKDRDLLLIDLCWELGGRIDDICNMAINMIDWNERVIKLYTKKRKKNIILKVSDSLLMDLTNYIRNYNIEGKIIGFSRQRAWQIIKQLGEDTLNINLHPHMFRHGNALYLMGKVPTPVISARLGHSNTAITQSLYQKVTPEIQEQFMKEIEFR